MVALLLGDNILTCSFPGCGGFAFQKGHKGTVIVPFLTEVKKLEKRSRLLFYGSHTGPRKKKTCSDVTTTLVFTRPVFAVLQYLQDQSSHCYFALFLAFY